MNSVSRLLMEKGFNPRLRGTAYFAQAVERVARSPKDYRFVTKELYPELAKLNGTTLSNVERCMRYALRDSGAACSVGRAVFELALGGESGDD